MSETRDAVCKLSEIRDGEMKEVQAGTTPVLLARVNGKCYALGAHCTHYGAPLAEGALSGDRIVCPWHHACFNAATGNMLEPPALDSLPNYPVRIVGDDIFVDVADPDVDRRTPEMSKSDPSEDQRVFVILGGGASGYMAAQTLREDGFKGRIVLVTRENRLPYDRPNLSKDYLHGHAEAEWMPLRSDDFFAEHNIEVLFDKEVTKLDPSSRTIQFGDGDSMSYDSVLIATGGIPRKLDLPGSDLGNIFVLRTFDNADEVIASAENAKRAVVIGASFIGMEAAFSLTERGISVTVVAPDKVPFEKTLGPEIGKLFQNVHEKHGVTFRLGENVKGFEGNKDVDAVLLESGDRIETDLVLVGIGVQPATKFLSGANLRKDGGVVTDDHLSLGDSIYASGDIAHFPDARTGETIRIEHWRTALQQGRTAAHNMAGKRTMFSSVPFFWTTQFDVTLNYVGHAKDWDEIIFQGDLSKRDFLAFYVKDHKVLAAAGMNRDKELAYLEELIRLNRMYSLDSIRSGSADLTHLNGKAAASRLPGSLL